MKIILVNVITKQQRVLLLYPAHNTYHYNQLIHIIKLYEPTLKPGQVLLQFKTNGAWQYIHDSFTINLSQVKQEMHFRYKVYKEIGLTREQTKIINKQVDQCVERLKIYKNIDTNIIDFNFFWASPLEKKIRNYNCQGTNTNQANLKYKDKQANLIDWKIKANGYFKQLGQAIRIKRKKALLYINTFNSECFKYRTEYQIVYIVCHTQNQMKDQKNGSKYYLVGEHNGVQNKIYVQDFYKMLEQKSIQLLILYTSCMNEHIKRIRDNRNIQNILLINESPINESKSTLLYLKQLFQFLLKGQGIKRAHQLSVQKVESDFKTDTSKFRLIKKNGKAFQFKDGDLQGDQIYLKGFTNKNKLVSNRILLIQLIRTFCLDENALDSSTFSFKIFNAYNENCSDKSVFIPEIKCQLIKRKFFKQVIVQTAVGWQKVNFKPKDPDTLYILFGHKFSSVQIKKLQKLCVNALLLTDQDLYIKKYDLHYNSSPIQPLNKNECEVYLKSHRKLTENMEQKVKKYIQFTWKEDFNHIYYPFNFDYNALMSNIAQFSITSIEHQNQYEEFKLLVRKLSRQKFKDYFFVMIIINHSPENQRIKFIQIIKNLNFYKQIKKNFFEVINSDDKFFYKNSKYFPVIYQDFFHQIYRYLSQILRIFVQKTFEQGINGDDFNRKSIWFYEATTITKRSQISILLNKYIEKLKKNENILISSDLKSFLKECNGYIMINTGLNIVKNILSFFDVFNSKEDIKIRKTEQQQIRQQIQMRKSLRREHKQQKKEKQNKQITEMLNLCLLMVNNAIIHRKNSQALKRTQENNENIEIIFKQKKENELILNQHKDETKKYFQQQQKQQQEQFQDENQIRKRYFQCINGLFAKMINQKQDCRLYSEKDFIIQVDCLSRKGLLYILSKIRNKLNESPKLLAICDSLAIQLQIQPGYEGEAIDEDNLSVLLKQSQQVMDNWDQDDLAAKYRIGYDILMCLILANTGCGRDKLNQYIWQKINHHEQEIFYRQLVQIQTQTGEQKQLYEYLKNLCESKQMHKQLIEHMRNFHALQSQDQRKEKISKQYYIMIQLWSKSQGCMKNIKNSIRCSQSFSQLLELKQQVSDQLTQKLYTQQFHVHCMVSSLSESISRFLSQISHQLLIILTDKSENFQQMIQKCEIDENELIIVYLRVNQNLYQLLEIQCRFLLFNLSNVPRFEGQFAEIGRKIYSNSCKFIFICDGSIKSQLSSALSNHGTKKYILSYNVDKYKLDEGINSIIMLIFSLHLVKEIVDFKLEIQEQVFGCINYIINFGINNDQKTKNEIKENLTVTMVEKIINKLKKNLKLPCQNSQNLSLSDIDCFINDKKSSQTHQKFGAETVK